MLLGLAGMQSCLFSTRRLILMSQRDDGFRGAFNVAFRGGSCVGLCAGGAGILLVYILLLGGRRYMSMEGGSNNSTEQVKTALLTGVSGFGLGASTVALFTRIGGGELICHHHLDDDDDDDYDALAIFEAY
jgi:K(+)-stimulated pyrophosphate-energized sodium pump